MWARSRSGEQALGRPPRRTLPSHTRLIVLKLRAANERAALCRRRYLIPIPIHLIRSHVELLREENALITLDPDVSACHMLLLISASFIWICTVSPQAHLSLHLPGPGEALLPALQRPGVLHSHPPANKIAAFQTPDSPNTPRDPPGRCQRWL